MKPRPVAAAKSAAVSIVVLTLCMTGVASRAGADTVHFVDNQVNIWFGTVEYYSPGGQFLFSKSAETVESSDLGQLGADGVRVMQLLGPDLVAQIQADSTVPAFFSQNLASFEDNNGLGLVDTNAIPTPAQASLSNLLTTNPVPTQILSDTGFVAFGAPFAFQYISDFGPFAPNTTDSYEVTTNVSLFTRDLHEELSTVVPEPRELVALGVCLTGLAFFRRRKVQAES